MLDVNNKEEMLKNLCKIRMGENKLWLSVARFVLEDGEINNSQEEKGKRSTFTNNKQPVHEDHTDNNTSTFEKGERSFKEILVGKTVTVDSNVNAFNGLPGRALIARMIDIDALKNIKLILNEICPSRGTVQYLGGLDVLISYEDAKTALAVREAAKSILGRFSMISIWEGQALGFKRLAWLKTQGIPLHLLSNEVIDVVGGLFGKVVHKANRSVADPDLSFEYVGVLVGDGKRVSEEVVMNWKDRKFRVWVMEELGEWLPDFLDVEVEQDASNNEESENESEKSMTSPEEDQRSIGDNNDDVTMTGVDLNLENTDGINENDFVDQELPVNDVVTKDGEINEVFIPTINFPFEKFLGRNLEGQQGGSQVNKRKKVKKGFHVGRPSFAYTSSQESLKVVKRTKHSDLFGLNSLLGLRDEDASSNDS
ncbi:hypothetical protein HanPI659440_Chr13g0482811 [Helianthus annuus]|nr:hypothetical protein HanPI659440_Chr13g0482811 [Helianthus annuus]